MRRILLAEDRHGGPRRALHPRFAAAKRIEMGDLQRVHWNDAESDLTREYCQRNIVLRNLLRKQGCALFCAGFGN